MSKPNRATPEGTAAYRDRFQGMVAQGHFRKLGELTVGSIGMGTYLGLHDDAIDAGYENALTEALRFACNHIDTAINYRCMRSEKAIGRALSRLFAEGAVSREEVFLSTKGGYIPFDGEPPPNIRGFIRSAYLEPGIVDEDDLVGGCHAMTPRFLEKQITRSLENLRVETIDLYYLHNPEVHRAVLPKPHFLDRVRRAFAFLEEEVERGRIGLYGVSSWEAFRAEPSSPVYISLEDLAQAAKEAAGDGHHFAAIQLPFNAAMMEGYALVAQEVGDEYLSAIDAAAHLGLGVTASAPLLQGRLLKRFPGFLDKGMRDLRSKSEKAIQFARSVPGIASVLVGMSRDMHVIENLSLARRPPLTEEELLRMFEE
ncbi:MAG: aldo/keto reductase [Candidatus Eisenbacteria bacterium]